MSRLRELFGTLSHVQAAEVGLPQIDDPLAVYAVTAGWVQRSDDEMGMSVLLADPAVSSRAILRFLCAGEAAEVTYGFSKDY